MFPTTWWRVHSDAGAVRHVRVRRVCAALLALVLALYLAPLPAMAEETTQDTTNEQGQAEGASAPSTRPTSGKTSDAAGGASTGDAAGGTGTGDAAGAASQTKDGDTKDDAVPPQDTTGQPSGQGSSEDGGTPAPTAPPKEEPPARAPDAEAATIDVSVRVVGPDAEGHDVDWLPATNVTVAATATGLDATEAAFKKGGLTYDAVEGTAYGAYLASITSPYTGQELGYDAASRRYWSLLVNTGSGLTSSGKGISSIDMSTVREIVWYYSTGTAAPAETPDTEPSSTQLPTYASDWSGFQQILGDQRAATPTDAATVAWDVDLSQYGSGGSWHRVSELLSVNGSIYAAVDDRVVRIDERTGTVDATRGTLDAPISYTSRPLYVKGMIVVALDDGRVEALDAATLKRRWTTPIMAKGYQSSCSLSLTSGSSPQIVIGISQGSGSAGMLFTVDPSTSSLASYRVLDQSQVSGWYWSGAASVGGCLVAADTAGRVSAYRTSDGREVASYQLTSKVSGGSTVNADVVALDETDFLVATRDGRLHRLRLTDANGTIGIAEVSSVALGGTGKAAPVVVGGHAFVGGARDTTPDAPTALYVVDTSTMSLLQTITKADGLDLPVGFGGISAPPLVSTTSTGTFAYFTVNAATFDAATGAYASGGNLYAYRLGDTEAHLLYAPTTNANFCDSPVICDTQGSLYYLNDSSHVVKLVSQKNGAGGRGSTTDAGGSGRTATPTSVMADGSTGPRERPGSLANMLAGMSGIRMYGTAAIGWTLRPSARATARARSSRPLLFGTPSDVLTRVTTTRPLAMQPEGQGAAAEPSSTSVAHLPLWPVAGMGCGAALLVVLLVRDLMRTRKGGSHDSSRHHRG